MDALEKKHPAEYVKAKEVIVENGLLALSMLKKIHGYAPVADSSKHSGVVTPEDLQQYHKDEERRRESDHELQGLEKKIFREAYSYFDSKIGKVEISRGGSNYSVYFIKPAISEYLTEEDVQQYNIGVDRKTTLHKIRHMLSHVEQMRRIMEYYYSIHNANYFLSFILSHNETYITISFFVVCIINIFVLLSYFTPDPTDFGLNMSNYSFVQKLSQSNTKLMIDVVGYFILFLGARFIIYHLVKNWFVYQGKKWIDKNVAYYSVYVAIICLTIWLHHFFASLLFYEIFNK